MSQTNSTITRFYTKREVADILRVSVRTVTRYMGCGLPYKKIRGTVRIPEDKLLNWLKTEKQQAEEYYFD
jgi:excisionase family DNA binding protein